MKTTTSTERQIAKLVDFRQGLYSHLIKRRDAQFELLDSLLKSRWVDSLAELSVASSFRRKWPTIYAALDDGEQQTDGLNELCLRQIPFGEIEHFVVDASSIRRSSSPTLKDRKYVHSATHEVGSKGIIVGHEYSILAWTERPHSSWCLAVHVKRVSSDADVLKVASEQIEWLCDNKPAKTLPRVALDGRYGNKNFFGLVKDTKCDIVARLRKDRVMYRKPSSYKGCGRRPKYGSKFRFKDSTTWGKPDESVEFDDERYGTVKLQLWGGLRFDYPHEVVEIDVLRASVHTQKEDPPEPRWYGWHGGKVCAEGIWRSFHYRWPVEPSIRYRKEHLHWQLPQTRTIGASERWTMLVTLAQWHLYLAREIVSYCPLSWQKKQSNLTPARVRQGLDKVFPMIGTPASAPRTRGKSKGWPKGRVRARPERYDIVKKGSKSKKTSKKAA